MTGRKAQYGPDEAALRLRLALDAASIGVWEYDVDTDKLTWDDRVYEVAQVDPAVEPRFADDFLNLVHSEDRPVVTEAFQRLIQQGEGAHLALTCRILGRRTGHLVWSALEGRCVAHPAGGLCVIGTARDVTAERLAREQLSQLNERLESRVLEAVAERQIWADMFQSAEDPIAAVDTSLRVIALNAAYASAFERYFGKQINVGDDLEAALSERPEMKPITMSLWRRALAGDVVDIPRSREADPNGAYFDIRFRPLNDRNGKRIGAFQYSRNVTLHVQAAERMSEAQALLNRAQKMESLGQLTGGVAHDFNNLLQVISGNLQLLRKDVAGNVRAERRVENALAGAARGSKLASQLLAFGRRQPLEPKVVNLGRLLNGMDDMLARALGEEIELETVISGGLWNTLVDPSQIENAVLNLAINARDAMNGQGRLTIEAGNALLDDEYARQHVEVTPGQYVMIAVTDTGVGMAPEIIDKVFEPFFSTKPEGQGTGLGLSMVHGLLKQSGGHAKIYSEVGEGTTVKLYLPRALETEDVWGEPARMEIDGGDETVLVVEDDDEVRETAVALLTDLGYKVLKASDAANGLAVLESGVKIDLLFTDVVMPGPLRSPDLARRAQDLAPHIAVLFTSGYTSNAIVHGGRLDRGVELLSKPYTREALARKIRHVLANAQQAMRARAATRAADAPRQADAPEPGAPEPGAPEAHPQTALELLLVEDDKAIRTNIAEILEDLGHKVVQAADAGSAIEELRARSFDLIIADRGLPDSSGDAFARRAREIAPSLKIVFASGEPVGLADDKIEDAVYLIKPYGLADLRQAIDQAMTAGPAPKATDMSPALET